MVVPWFRNPLIGSRLQVLFAFLTALILGGNGVLVWQFSAVQSETDRVNVADTQMISALLLQRSILDFHKQLEDLSSRQNSAELVEGTERMKRSLLNQLEQARASLTSAREGPAVEPTFLPTLDSMEVVFLAQVEAVSQLAKAGDWVAARYRVERESASLESQTSALVGSLNEDVATERLQAAREVGAVEKRIVFLVPLNAIFTFAVATFFGRSINRSMTSLRLEERVAERTRLAQNLHDTLLQGCMSALMQLHLAVDALPAGSPDQPRLAGIVELMRTVVDQGREAVRGFRTPPVSDSLYRSFLQVAEECGVSSEAKFTVTVEGVQEPLHPVIRDEVYAIGREAMMNATRHAMAKAIAVELEYQRRYFALVIRDDGVGMEERTLASGREGHWGLIGMRERAAHIGARLTVMSRVGAGTEVRLSVPRKIAFGPLRSQTTA